MKALKQRAIPKGSVELVMRGSKFDEGQLSVKVVIPNHHAAEIIKYALGNKSLKQKQIKL